MLAGATPKPEDTVTAADASIVQASVFHARPLGDKFAVVGAGRYGTRGLIIEALASNVMFRYWDYESRLFYTPTPRDQVEVTVFGAGNEVGEQRSDGPDSVLKLGFHRLLLRGRRAVENGSLQLDLEPGQEGFSAPEDDEATASEQDEQEGLGDAEYRCVGSRSGASFSPAPDFEFRTGLEGYVQDFGFRPAGAEDEFFLPENGLTFGAYLEAEWTPSPWSVLSGVRVEHYRYGMSRGPRQTGADPRVAVGYDLTQWLTAKASAGMFQGPPRVTLVEGPIVVGPIPGMMGVGLDRGLTRALQTSTRLDAKLPWRLSAEARGFYNVLDVPLDSSLMNTPLRSNCDQDPCAVPPADVTDANDDAPPRTKGSSYGLKLLVRRSLGASLFGWLSYTLSRSERDVPGVGTLPFAFDQTHVLDAVTSWEVGRHWTLGSSFHYHSGRPYTPERVAACDVAVAGRPFATCNEEPFAGRLPPFWRIDARVQKREVYDTWYFDFYLDIMNVTFNREAVGYELTSDGRIEADRVLIFVPMLGLRGQL